MMLSVVIRTKDEAPRLRLTLASLMRQTVTPEVVVIDDGSRDATPEVIAEASRYLDLVTHRHETAQGRSAASNAGAKHARGDILLFLDGDTLAHRQLVQHHLALHAAEANVIGRGENSHLRCTRFLRDPETGSPMPEARDRIARLSPAEQDRLRVTRAQVLDDFGAIERRAERGIYPGSGSRTLQETEFQALREADTCSVLWAAACGSNQSVPRQAFLAAGGFHDAIDINEHRELALRLCQSGLRMRPVKEARAFHLTHRSGWRDPLLDTGWEDVFLAAHPLPEAALLPIFWSSLAGNSPLSDAEKILTLPALETAAREWGWSDINAARARLNLKPGPVA